MGNVPRWYVPTYLLIKLPLFMLVGVAVALLFILRPGDATPQTPDRRSETALLAFIAAFPVVSIVVERGPAFTGLRPLLFGGSGFSVLAGIGFDALLAQCETRRRWLANAAAAT